MCIWKLNKIIWRFWNRRLWKGKIQISIHVSHLADLDGSVNWIYTPHAYRYYWVQLSSASEPSRLPSNNEGLESADVGWYDRGQAKIIIYNYKPNNKNNMTSRHPTLVCMLRFYHVPSTLQYSINYQVLAHKLV